MLLDLERQPAPHPLTQANIATAVLDKTGTLSALLLALYLGNHLSVHGGVRRFAAHHQPTFLQGLLGDLLVVHWLLAAVRLKHLLSAIGEGETRS